MQGAEMVEHFAKNSDPVRSVHPDDLVSSKRWVGKRSEQIENGPHAQLAPYFRYRLEGRMVIGRKQKPNANLRNAFLYALERNREVDAKRDEHIRRPTAGGHGAVPVFGDHHPRSRGDERGGGRNVEGITLVATGSAGINEDGAVYPNRTNARADYLGRPGNLLHGLALEPETGQKSSDLRRGDRKSTRLNSSHDQISYAVFCLKKKKKKQTQIIKKKQKKKKKNKKKKKKKT